MGRILFHPIAMDEHELLWAMLPEGTSEYFELGGFEKDDLHFRIILVEKNKVPEDLSIFQSYLRLKSS